MLPKLRRLTPYYTAYSKGLLQSLCDLINKFSESFSLFFLIHTRICQLSNQDL